MHGLGRPIRVCVKHVAALACARGCMGVRLDGLTEVRSSYPNCHCCEGATSAAPVVTLRRCGGRRCSGFYRRSSWDEFSISERAARLLHPLGRAA